MDYLIPKNSSLLKKNSVGQSLQNTDFIKSNLKILSVKYKSIYTPKMATVRKARIIIPNCFIFSMRVTWKPFSGKLRHYLDFIIFSCNHVVRYTFKSVNSTVVLCQILCNLFLNNCFRFCYDSNVTIKLRSLATSTGVCACMCEFSNPILNLCNITFLQKLSLYS